ncbi:hypothetical protein [Microbacterium oxydans]|nr:hypothetical protein [Microbacterium oxydans]
MSATAAFAVEHMQAIDSSMAPLGPGDHEVDQRLAGEEVKFVV